MGSVERDLPWVIGREQPSQPVMSGPQQAVVISVDGSGIYFHIPAYSSDWKFGPARWSRPAAANGNPPAGTTCLVMFVGSGVDQPWVVAFASWPA